MLIDNNFKILIDELQGINRVCPPSPLVQKHTDREAGVRRGEIRNIRPLCPQRSITVFHIEHRPPLQHCLLPQAQPVSRTASD